MAPPWSGWFPRLAVPGMSGSLTRMCMTTSYRIENTDYTIICVDEIDGDSQPGNSGAVAFERTSDPYDVNVRGMLIGSTDDDDDGETDFWFLARIEAMRQELAGFNPIAIPTTQ